MKLEDTSQKQRQKQTSRSQKSEARRVRLIRLSSSLWNFADADDDQKTNALKWIVDSWLKDESYLSGKRGGWEQKKVQNPNYIYLLGTCTA